MDDIFCRDVSLAAGEPLAGTAAADTDHWLLIETRTPWGAKGVEDSGLPAALLERLSALDARVPRLRIQLVRQPEVNAGPLRIFFCTATPEVERLAAIEVQTLEQAAELDFEALSSGEQVGGARVETEPLYLVCVHGRRDRCCAQRGMPVYRAFRASAPQRTFQTTHLGGHRFAATMLVLPHGICYGRVEAEEAPAIMAAHARAELHDLARLRGRTAYGPEAQAAEHDLREELRDVRLSSLTLQGVTRDGDRTEVRFLHRPSGASHLRSVQREALGSLPASCGAAPKRIDKLVPLRLTSR